MYLKNDINMKKSLKNSFKVSIKGTDKVWRFTDYAEFLGMQDFLCMKFNCTKDDIIISK